MLYIPMDSDSIWIQLSPIESEEMGDTRMVGVNAKSMEIVQTPQQLDSIDP